MQQPTKTTKSGIPLYETTFEGRKVLVTIPENEDEFELYDEEKQFLKEIQEVA